MQIEVDSFAAAGLDGIAGDANNSAIAKGALPVDGPEEVAEKILRHSEALGGISRVTFQMDTALLPHARLMRSIELLGSKVAPLVNK